MAEIVEMINLKEQFYLAIFEERASIADLKKQKAEMKAPLWEEATGTVDQKKDFIKSKTAEIDYQIAMSEAEIELRYNQARIIDEKVDLKMTEEDG